MSEKRRWPLADARAVAERWLAMLAPVCERVQIAGSARREKPEVGDIELVYVPRMVKRFGAMFDDDPRAVPGGERARVL